MKIASGVASITACRISKLLGSAISGDINAERDYFLFFAVSNPEYALRSGTTATPVHRPASRLPRFLSRATRVADDQLAVKEDIPGGQIGARHAIEHRRQRRVAELV